MYPYNVLLLSSLSELFDSIQVGQETRSERRAVFRQWWQQRTQLPCTEQRISVPYSRRILFEASERWRSKLDLAIQICFSLTLLARDTVFVGTMPGTSPDKSGLNEVINVQHWTEGLGSPLLIFIFVLIAAHLIAFVRIPFFAPSAAPPLAYFLHSSANYHFL